MTRNVLLFGGSFDPVHVGHEITATYCLDTLMGEDGEEHELWFMPSCSDAFDYREYASFEHRLNMLHLVNDTYIRRKDVKVSDFEARLGNGAGVFAVVKALMNTFPTLNFKYLMGSDQAAAIRNWRKSRDLTKLIPFIVISRRGSLFTSSYWYRNKPHRYIQTHALDKRNLTSSNVRSLLENESKRKIYQTRDRSDIRDSVKEYIYNNDLYRGGA